MLIMLDNTIIILLSIIIIIIIGSLFYIFKDCKCDQCPQFPQIKPTQKPTQKPTPTQTQKPTPAQTQKPTEIPSAPSKSTLGIGYIILIILGVLGIIAGLYFFYYKNKQSFIPFRHPSTNYLNDRDVEMEQLAY